MPLFYQTDAGVVGSDRDRLELSVYFINGALYTAFPEQPITAFPQLILPSGDALLRNGKQERKAR